MEISNNHISCYACMTNQQGEETSIPTQQINNIIEGRVRQSSSFRSFTRFSKCNLISNVGYGKKHSSYDRYLRKIKGCLV